MPNPTISIITSVYNAKDYLPRTVASILAQTFTDFELLLVEDGSPNGCGELCDELAKTDPRIRVFHKPNGGPASASNMGLDNARGDYVGFVDSDDLIEPTMYETLLNAIRDSGAAIAACAGDAIDEQDALIPGQTVALRQYGKIDAMALILETFQTGSFYGPLSWNKLFDIRLFRERNIHYDETMLFGDDASVLHLVFEGQQAICLPDRISWNLRFGSWRKNWESKLPLRNCSLLAGIWRRAFPAFTESPGTIMSSALCTSCIGMWNQKNCTFRKKRWNRCGGWNTKSA